MKVVKGKSHSKKKSKKEIPSDQWPLWEVFVQTGSGRNHEHVGSVHAPDKEMALLNGRDVYARRDKVTSIWVVPSNQITATTPSDQGPFFEPASSTPYRHPQFYSLPKNN